MDALDFIKGFSDEYAVLFEAQTTSYYKASISGSDEDYALNESAQKKMIDFLSDKSKFNKVNAYISSADVNSISQRELVVIRNLLLPFQGDKEVLHKISDIETNAVKKFNNFRVKVGERVFSDNEVNDILSKSSDSVLREEVWQASKEIGAVVEKDILELVNLRNKLAQSLGYKNFYHLGLAQQEQSYDEILELFDKLDVLTKDSFEVCMKDMQSDICKRFNIDVASIRPWHFEDRFFQEPISVEGLDLDSFYDKDVIEVSRKFFDSVGLSASDVLDRSSLYPQEGKCQHAFAEDLNRSGNDVVILLNVKNNESWLSTTLHELGHAVYWKGIDSSLPFLLKETAHTFATEAVAMFFGRFTKLGSFASQYSSVPNLSTSDIALFEKSLRRSMLVLSRWVQVMVRFEMGLYDNPNQDLNLLWWDLVKRYQLVDFSRDAPDWASKYHILNAPVYYHNYLLGELLASQFTFYLYDVLGFKDFNSVDSNFNPALGDFFKGFFKYGLSLHYNDLIKKVTGNSLDPAFFAKQFLD